MSPVLAESLYLKSFIADLGQHLAGTLRLPAKESNSPLEPPYSLTLTGLMAPDEDGENTDGETEIHFSYNNPSWLGRHYQLVASARNQSSDDKTVPLTDFWRTRDQLDRFVILGETGAGKTTLLRMVALQAAHDRTDNPLGKPLPLWINLAEWEDNTNFVRFLESYWTLEGRLMRRLETGGVLLLLDGLNEIPGNATKKIGMIRDWLAREDNAAAVVFTARTASYGEQMELFLPTVEINPLTPSLINLIAVHNLGEENAPSFLAKILPADSSGDSTPALPRTAQTFFFFNLLLSLHRQSPEATLPAKQGIALRDYIRHLWEKEEIQKIAGGLSFAEMMRTFSQIAFLMIQDGEPLTVTRDWFITQIDGKKRWRKAEESYKATTLLKAMNAASLMKIAGERVSFAHRWLQLAFAAEYFILQQTLPELDPSTTDALSGSRIPGKWDQVLLLLTDLLPEPDAIIQEIAENDVFLAADLLLQGVAVGVATHTVLKENMLKLLAGGEWRIANAILRLSSQLDIVPFVDTLIQRVAFGQKIEQQLAVRMLGMIRHPAAAPVLVQVLQNPEIEELAVKALINIGKPAVPEVIHALSYERWEVVHAAVQILRAISDPVAIPALLDVLYSAEHEVRWAAADALATLGEPAVEGLLQLLQEENGEDEDLGDIHRAIASALVWTHSPAAIEGLIKALAHPNTDVRCAAAEALGESQSPSAIPALSALTTDSAYSEWADTTVGQAATRALRQLEESQKNLDKTDET